MKRNIFNTIGFGFAVPGILAVIAAIIIWIMDLSSLSMTILLIVSGSMLFISLISFILGRFLKKKD